MHKKVLRVLAAFGLLFCLTCPTAALAEGGEQAGSTGVSGEKPLYFTGITLVDSGEKVADAADIPLSPKFKLSFDKNVVNSLYWENNSQCFSLSTESMESVPLKVTKIDDTIDFTQRQNIFVEPVDTLSPGTSYTLSISPALRAKNGVSTLGGTTDGAGVMVSFKTAGQAQKAAETMTKEVTAPPTESAQQQTNSSIRNETAPAPETASAENATRNESQETANPLSNQTEAETLKDDSSNNSDQTSNLGLSKSNVIAIIGAVIVIGWIALEIFFRKKKNNAR